MMHVRDQGKSLTIFVSLVPSLSLSQKKGAMIRSASGYLEKAGILASTFTWLGLITNYSYHLPKLGIKIVSENITFHFICNGYHCLLPKYFCIWLEKDFFLHFTLKLSNPRFSHLRSNTLIILSLLLGRLMPTLWFTQECFYLTLLLLNLHLQCNLQH